MVRNKQHHESADREAVMSGKWGRMFAGVMIALPLGACITMQKKEDGKTHISIPNPLAGLLKGEEADSRGGKSTGNAMQDRRQAAQTAAGGSSTRQTSANGNGSGEVALFDPRWTDAPMISETPLANLWRKHPWDGQGLGQYPAVALTIVDWSFSTNHFRQRMQNGGAGGSGDGCWVAKARIWWSGKKSQQVDPFKVCWKSSLGMAMTFAPAIQTYMLQVPAGQHTGHKRTTGPLPPMLAEPDQQDSPVGLDGVGSSNFMIQFFAETGWKATQTMNLWITGYDSSEEPKNKRSASTRNWHSSDEASPGAPADVEGKTAKM